MINKQQQQRKKKYTYAKRKQTVPNDPSMIQRAKKSNNKKNDFFSFTEKNTFDCDSLSSKKFQKQKCDCYQRRFRKRNWPSIGDGVDRVINARKKWKKNNKYNNELKVIVLSGLNPLLFAQKNSIQVAAIKTIGI